MEFTIEQTWGSHRPLLHALLEVLRPVSAIECGCGEYSTPLLVKNTKKLITIEHDLAWAQKMMVQFPASEKHQWYIEPVRGQNGTPREWYPEGAVEVGVVFYQRVARELSKCDFLFMDTFRVFRVPGVIHLGPLADLILLHDLEDNSPKWYEYHLLKGHLDDRKQYMFRPQGKKDNGEHIPWSALFSRTELPLEKIQKALTPLSMEMWGFDGILALEKVV